MPAQPKDTGELNSGGGTEAQHEIRNFVRISI